MDEIKKYLMYAAFALLIVMIVVIDWKVKKIFREHPRLKRNLIRLGKTIMWISIILMCIILCLIGMGGVVFLGVGAFFVYHMCSKGNKQTGAQPETQTGIRTRAKAKKKSGAEAWLEEQRRMNAADMVRWQERKAREEKERQAARAEAERMEREARHWESVYQKTGTYYDKQKAESSRARANEAHRKAW